MHTPHSWPSWPPPQDSSLPMLLGRLLERSEDHGRTLERIDRRLEEGQVVMTGLHTRLTAIERRKSRTSAPAVERWIKSLLQLLLPLITLWLTGSIELAVELVKARAGG